MSDKELLELAAKAAGIEAKWEIDPNFKQERLYLHVYYDSHNMMTGFEWNPLLDDTDAFRLAVKLKLCFGPNFDGDLAVCFGDDGNNMTEPFGNNPYAATRRAIVRAAAEIGKAMK